MYLRFGIFIAAVLIFGLFQKWRPLVKLKDTGYKRSLYNFLHPALAQGLLFVFFTVVGASFFEISKGLSVGLFYLFELPYWLRFLITFVVFDFALYLQHLASHRWTWFWGIHRMHHSDEELTTSTAIRFHVLEIFISAIWKGLLIIALGASLEIFVFFEIFLSFCALFNHSNMQIGAAFNAFLEKFLVTPELHRIHHSTDLKLTHSNFGFSVILWDKLFGTFNESRPVEDVGVKGLNMTSLKAQLLLKGESS